MNEANAPVIYQTLVEKHGQIRIPMLQRGYAQGRDDLKEIRERFLDALQEALEWPGNDFVLVQRQLEKARVGVNEWAG